MTSILDRYLDRVLVYANRPQSETDAIRQELRDHLLQKRDDLIKEGLSAEDAQLEALRQHGSPKIIGYKLRAPFPWIDIRSHGTARGVIAIGPRAVGIVAFGGVAVGLFACGGLPLGILSIGGLACGLFAMGGLAVGGMTLGGLTFGVVATGGLAIGAWVPDAGKGISYYTVHTVPPLLHSMSAWFKTNLGICRWRL